MVRVEPEMGDLSLESQPGRCSQGVRVKPTVREGSCVGALGQEVSALIFSPYWSIVALGLAFVMPLFLFLVF